jgi:hypothetical protein
MRFTILTEDDDGESYYVDADREVQVSDGDIRHFLPGDIVLVEDVRGKRHTTRVVSDDAGRGVYVQLPDE